MQTRGRQTWHVDLCGFIPLFTHLTISTESMSCSRHASALHGAVMASRLKEESDSFGGEVMEEHIRQREQDVHKPCS